METPDKDLVLNCACYGGAVHIHEPLGLTCRWRIAGTEAGRNQTVLIAQISWKDRESDRISRAAVYHAVTIKRIYADAVKGCVVRKLIHRQIVGIGPESKLRIVAEVRGIRRIDLHSIEPPPAGNWITGF